MVIDKHLDAARRWRLRSFRFASRSPYGTGVRQLRSYQHSEQFYSGTIGFCGFRRRGQVTNRVEALDIRIRDGEDAALRDEELAESPLFREWPRPPELNTIYHRS